MSIQAVKAVSIGEGVESAGRFGSEHHDGITYDATAGRFTRPTNRAGGIEGGISNGEMLRVRCFFKPLATLPRPLPSIDLVSKEPFEAVRERTDTIPIDSYALKVVSNEFHDGQPVTPADVSAAFERFGEWQGMAFWFWDYD